MHLSLPSELVAGYPEQIQRLLGWSAGSNPMGWVERDGQMFDPIHFLRGEGLAGLRGVGARSHPEVTPPQPADA